MAVVCLVAGWTAPASADPAARAAIPAQVRALHTLADLGTNVTSFCTTLIDNAAAEMTNPASTLNQNFDAATRTRWFAAIEAACNADEARERHLAAFAAGYDPESARAVTDWYTSETGRRLLALEQAAADTDWDAQVLPFIEEINREPVPVERVKIAERIDAATGATEDTALLQSGITSILTYGGRALAPETERVPRAEIDAQLEALRQQIAGQMRAQQAIIFMFVYRDASDAELEAFAQFAESDAARWLFATHRMAMLQLIAETREDVEARLGG
jgi:hypothetical protein